jgi:hypothetical protein
MPPMANSRNRLDTGKLSAKLLADELAMSRDEMAQYLRVPVNVVSRSPGSAKLQENLERLENLLRRVQCYLPEQNDYRGWLRRLNPELMRKPIDMLLEGQIEFLEHELWRIETGLPD